MTMREVTQGIPPPPKKKADVETGFLTSPPLLQALIVPVYTHDISPNYREAGQRYHTPRIAEHRGGKRNRELIFDTPSLAVESNPKQNK